MNLIQRIAGGITLGLATIFGSGCGEAPTEPPVAVRQGRLEYWPQGVSYTFPETHRILARPGTETPWDYAWTGNVQSQDDKLDILNFRMGAVLYRGAQDLFDRRVMRTDSAQVGRFVDSTDFTKGVVAQGNIKPREALDYSIRNRIDWGAQDTIFAEIFVDWDSRYAWVYNDGTVKPYLGKPAPDPIRMRIIGGPTPRVEMLDGSSGKSLEENIIKKN